MLARVAQQILVLRVKTLSESSAPSPWGGLSRAVRSGIVLQSGSDLIHVRGASLFGLPLCLVYGFLLDRGRTVVIQMSVAERGVAPRAYSAG